MLQAVISNTGLWRNIGKTSLTKPAMSVIGQMLFLLNTGKLAVQAPGKLTFGIYSGIQVFLVEVKRCSPLALIKLERTLH